MHTPHHVTKRATGRSWQRMPSVLLAGLGGGFLTIGLAVALVLGGLPSGNGTAQAPASRPFNRIFADEAAYLPTVEEYQTMELALFDRGLASSARRVVTNTAGESLSCRTLLATAIAPCLPTTGEPETLPATMGRTLGPR